MLINADAVNEKHVAIWLNGPQAAWAVRDLDSKYGGRAPLLDEALDSIPRNKRYNATLRHFAKAIGVNRKLQLACVINSVAPVGNKLPPDCSRVWKLAIVGRPE
jgi:hypothetical protein